MELTWVVAFYIKDKYKVTVARLLIFSAGTIEEIRNTCKGKWRWVATVEGMGAYREEMGTWYLVHWTCRC